MTKIDVLIIDDNLVIAGKIKERLSRSNLTYGADNGLAINVHFLEIDVKNPTVAAGQVNRAIDEKKINYLLLDRGIGTILSPDVTVKGSMHKDYLYKDNDAGGYPVESILAEMKVIPNNKLKKIKGVILYTYDAFFPVDHTEERIKQDFSGIFKPLLDSKCVFDVLLTYSDVYKPAGVILYERWQGSSIIRLGRKKEFLLYGIFVGELLYHKLIHIAVTKTNNKMERRQTKLTERVIILFLVLTSVSVGGNAVYSTLFAHDPTISIAVCIVFGLIFPLFIIRFKPTVLIDLKS